MGLNGKAWLAGLVGLALIAAAGCGSPAAPQTAGNAGGSGTAGSSSGGMGYGPEYGGYGSGGTSGGSGGAPAGTSEGGATSSNSSEATGTSPSQGGSTSEPAGATASETAGPQTVDVDLYEFKIEIGGTEVDHDGTVTVPAGRVTFAIKNEGGATHAFEIKGDGIDVKTKSLGPGDTDTLTVDLKPGKYEIWCPVGHHRDLGMQGVITVQ